MHDPWAHAAGHPKLEGDVAQPRRNAKLQVGEKFGAALAEIMVILSSTLNAMPVPQRLNASHPTLTTHVSVATLHPCPPATLFGQSAPALCTDCNVSRGFGRRLRRRFELPSVPVRVGSTTTRCTLCTDLWSFQRSWPLGTLKLVKTRRSKGK